MQKELNPENVKLMTLALAKYFTDTGRNKWIPAQDVIYAVKIPGFRKNEIKEARKQLEIESQSINGIYHWRWSKQEDPEKVWEELSHKIWEEIPK